MEVLYTNSNIPVLSINGEAFRFTTDDIHHILSHLILHPETIDEIKNHSIDYINSIKNNITEINESSSYPEILDYMQSLNMILSMHAVFEILEEANSNYLKFTTEKPYESWQWNKYKLEWEAPIEYPGVVGDNVYIWNEAQTEWEPLLTRPFPSWIWNQGSNEWVAPIFYPLDANPGDFRWDEDLGKWVANV